MKVYVILREYYNGVCVIDETFSSMKKAKAAIEHIKYWCDKDGWSVTNNYRHMSGKQHACIEICSPSGRRESIERYYIIPQEVK